jgi:hypothetical protein
MPLKQHVAREVGPKWVALVEAAQLAVLNFERSSASGNFLGDDDHEAWTALTKALDALGATHASNRVTQ